MSRYIGKEIREIQQLIHRKIEFSKDEQPAKLTNVQIQVLLFIYKQDQPIFQKNIEQYLTIQRSTATQILNVLEREGYITRERIEEDGRMKQIITTEKTLVLIDEMKDFRTETELLLQQNIPEEELDIFFKVVEQIKENLERG